MLFFLNLFFGIVQYSYTLTTISSVAFFFEACSDENLYYDGPLAIWAFGFERAAVFRFWDETNAGPCYMMHFRGNRTIIVLDEAGENLVGTGKWEKLGGQVNTSKLCVTWELTELQRPEAQQEAMPAVARVYERIRGSSVWRQEEGNASCYLVPWALSDWKKAEPFWRKSTAMTVYWEWHPMQDFRQNVSMDTFWVLYSSENPSTCQLAKLLSDQTLVIQGKNYASRKGKWSYDSCTDLVRFVWASRSRPATSASTTVQLFGKVGSTAIYRGLLDQSNWFLFPTDKDRLHELDEDSCLVFFFS